MGILCLNAQGKRDQRRSLHLLDIRAVSCNVDIGGYRVVEHIWVDLQGTAHC